MAPYEGNDGILEQAKIVRDAAKDLLDDTEMFDKNGNINTIWQERNE